MDGLFGQHRGAERIRGELLKLDIRVATSTIQGYLREARPPRPAGQPWATFLRNHAPDIWACDFLPVTDLLFRPVYAFFVIALGTRRAVHVGATRLCRLLRPSARRAALSRVRRVTRSVESGAAA